MHAGSLRVRKDAGDYLGLLMSGGSIRVMGKAGRRAGWRMKGGCIEAGAFGEEAGDKCRTHSLTGQ
jgi:formylmethanofuran dehydrogenase subunit C